MDLYILCSGEGSRFQKAGFKMPKPMLELRTSNFLHVSYSSLQSYNNWQNVYVTVLKKHVDEFAIDQFVMSNIPNARVLIFKEATKGPLDSIVKALEITRSSNNFTVADCDQAIKGQLSLTANNKSNTQNLAAFVPIFKSNNPEHSFAKVTNGAIEAIAEKEIISDYAVAGAYTFIDFQKFKTSAYKILTSIKREPYISDVLQDFLSLDLRIKAVELDWNISFGTPAELEKALTDQRLDIFIQ